MCAASSAIANEGPFIDPDLIRAMEDKPGEAHPIIVVVRLARTAVRLESLLPTPEEYNECTARWLAWEELEERCDRGEEISDEELEHSEKRLFRRIRGRWSWGSAPDPGIFEA